jgi:hypothetical protein
LLLGGAGLAALIAQGREDFRRFEQYIHDDDFEAWSNPLQPVPPKLSRDERN